MGLVSIKICFSIITRTTIGGVKIKNSSIDIFSRFDILELFNYWKSHNWSKDWSLLFLFYLSAPNSSNYSIFSQNLAFIIFFDCPQPLWYFDDTLVVQFFRLTSTNRFSFVAVSPVHFSQVLGHFLLFFIILTSIPILIMSCRKIRYFHERLDL